MNSLHAKIQQMNVNFIFLQKQGRKQCLLFHVKFPKERIQIKCQALFLRKIWKISSKCSPIFFLSMQSVWTIFTWLLWLKSFSHKLLTLYTWDGQSTSNIFTTFWMTAMMSDLVFYVPFNITQSYQDIATDKREYPHHILLISLQKHMLWVLIRSASARCY